MGRAEYTIVTEDKCRLLVVIFFNEHSATPDWVKNRVGTSFQMTARFGKINYTLRKDGMRFVLAAKRSHKRKTSTSNYTSLGSREVQLLLCRNALHFKHYGVIYRLEQMPKYRHTMRLVVNAQNVAFTPRR